MKTAKTLFVIILCYTSLNVYSQNKNLDIVKLHYPEIYTSILEDAERQWSNDINIKEKVIEGQAQAFLDIAESQVPMDSRAMTDALLKNSLPKCFEHNTKTINNASIKNPFPLYKMRLAQS